MDSPTLRVVRGACPHDCPDTCALRVTVQGGRVVRVQGDPDHPPTHGALCNKVSRYPERTHSPERVLHPLRRVGAKGSGQFERIGWDEALDAVAAPDRGRYHCRVCVGRRARPGVVNGLGVWWRKFGLRGTNVNELTSQRLTDIGRGPTFYDCRVEVRPA